MTVNGDAWYKHPQPPPHVTGNGGAWYKVPLATTTFNCQWKAPGTSTPQPPPHLTVNGGLPVQGAPGHCHVYCAGQGVTHGVRQKLSVHSSEACKCAETGPEQPPHASSKVSAGNRRNSVYRYDHTHILDGAWPGRWPLLDGLESVPIRLCKKREWGQIIPAKMRGEYLSMPLVHADS